MSTRAFRSWALWRRVQYAVGFFSVWGMIGVLVYYINFYVPPNCLDLVQNGDETGVDCGGSCVQICAADVLPPRVVWTKSFKITDGQYNAVAYIENQNQTAAIPTLEYTFTLYDGSAVVAERSGTTPLPPNSVYPIFEGRIFTDKDVEVTRAEITLTPASLWLPASIGRDQFRTAGLNLTGADVRPELAVEIENTEIFAAEDVEVVATIFNENGEAVTASQTFIEQIAPRSTSDIVFTWPLPIAKTVKNCIIPTDVVMAIDLSGSMNNDGGDPPQPVTDALQAAAQFINGFREEDQVAVATFATRAAVTTELTQLHGAVANAVLGLTIDPVEETGYTNTAAALEVAQAELNSARHNGDARRVLVILTDGLPTARGDADVVTKAEETAMLLDADGIEVYAIGLGQQVDATFIERIASSPRQAYLAPTAGDLAEIYDAITSSLCEVGATKIDIIAKTKTNFAPIR